MPVAADARSDYARAYNAQHKADRKRSERFRDRWSAGKFAILPPRPVNPDQTHAYSHTARRWLPCQIMHRHDAPKKPTAYPLIYTVYFAPDPATGFVGGLEDVALANVVTP